MPKIVDHDQRRKDIAAAACRAIARSGVERVTMTEIAEEAGYTTGMVTHYYKKKESILLAALGVMRDRAEHRLAVLMQSGRAAVEDIILDVMPIDVARRQEAAIWLSFWGLVVSDPIFARINKAVHKEWVEIFGQIIQYRWPNADVWPVDAFEDVRIGLLAMMNGLTVGAMTSPGDYPVARQRRVITNHFTMIDAWVVDQPHFMQQRKQGVAS